jgi:hypothetical protein
MRQALARKRLAPPLCKVHYLFIINSQIGRFPMQRPDPELVVQTLLTAPQGLRAVDIVRRLKSRVSQPTLWRVLNKLRSEGRVTMEGSARATRYHATERGDLSTLRSLRLHEAVAQRLVRDPSLLAVAGQRLHRLREVNPHGAVYHDRWAALLDGPLARLLRTMTEPSEQAATLRQESPFTGLVPADERRRIFESLRAA